MPVAESRERFGRTGEGETVPETDAGKENRI